MKWVTQALSWVAAIIVARLLTPADYGIVGMAGIFLGLMNLLSEFGIGQAVVALRDFSEEKIAQVNGLAVLFGLTGFLAACACAVPLGQFFNTPALPVVLIVLSSTFVISAFRTVPFALLQKAFRFRELALMDLGGSLIGMVVSVAFAALGFRYWTLVLSGIIVALFATGYVLRLSRTRFAWPRMRFLRDVVTFSANALVGRVSWFVYSNADFAVVGKVLGQSALGVYSFAWTLANLPIEKVTAMVGAVTPSFFSATQHDLAGLRRYLLLLTEALSLITFPAAIGLALVAEDLVRVALGPQWLGAVVPLRILACYASIRSIQPLTGHVLMVTGEAGWAARLGVLTAILMPAGFYYASAWGVNGVAVAWLTLYPLHFVACYVRVARRIDCPIPRFWQAAWPATSGCLVMALVVLGLGRLAVAWNPVPRLCASVAIGALTYVAFIVLAHGHRVRKFRSALSELRSRA